MVGAVIRSLRGSAGLKQKHLADSVGISASMLSLIESGKREPTIRLLRDIARALDIPAATLLVAAVTEEPVDPTAPTSPEMEKARALANHLILAAQHSIVLRQLQCSLNSQQA